MALVRLVFFGRKGKRFVNEHHFCEILLFAPFTLEGLLDGRGSKTEM